MSAGCQEVSAGKIYINYFLQAGDEERVPPAGGLQALEHPLLHTNIHLSYIQRVVRWAEMQCHSSDTPLISRVVHYPPTVTLESSLSAFVNLFVSLVPSWDPLITVIYILRCRPHRLQYIKTLLHARMVCGWCGGNVLLSYAALVFAPETL